MSQQAPAFVLASASPRRRELLAAMGIPFEVRASEVDESTIAADQPRTFALRAAYAKAMDVARRLPVGTPVLAADTVVALRSVLYGKPADADDARHMLEQLSGETHEVITAIALARAGSLECHLASETTAVTFRRLTAEEIDAYIATGEPFDKAGGYGIQGAAADLIDHIDGDYFNVVGLPCGCLLELLERAGFEGAGAGEGGRAWKEPEAPGRWG
ncbi:MAG: Maf family protein [Candidatus Sumerlaeia bacterium]|nr:Maf family protein [Candidatus Sumerlaeia bacterium]